MANTKLVDLASNDPLDKATIMTTLTLTPIPGGENVSLTGAESSDTV